MLLSFGCFAQKTSEGFVKRVIDCDTYVVQALSYKKQPATITVRLINCDCPEIAFKPKRRIAQEFGEMAADSVRALIEGQTVKLTYYGQDRYGRVLAFVRIGGERLDNIILSHGWGWAYQGYTHGRNYSEGVKRMNEAKRDSLGLWAFPNPIEPSVYRK